MKVAILGTGLIGGSIGLALRSVPEVRRIVAYDRDPRSAQRAVERGAADAHASTPAEAAEGTEVVFVATPVGAIPGVVAQAATALASGALVTDVGSTKSRVVREVEAILTSTGASFVGGHPMAGTEEEGIEAAKPSLFEAAWWILTPTEQVEPAAYKRLHSLITAMGAQVLAMRPDQHDELLAVISHLPHLTATALMNLAAERGKDHAGLLALAAGGFRDVTRVAASNPEIWLDICRENSEAIGDALRAFAERLTALGSAIEAGDREELRRGFAGAREARRRLSDKPVEGTLYQVLVPVPDRPGVLAEITTLVGNLGVNIEDLEISHAPEGGRGALRLTLMGSESAKAVTRALRDHGFEPRSTSI